ncbi:unnamed protein product [Aspergillus oryzae]|uniref:Unnamed protein product n=1 Tax=Aspergillus oryzae TaxID=5062 RepID=A0AAN5C353_ASPOZ|nr:unnamed protein product [Aspergillus oryzae]
MPALLGNVILWKSSPVAVLSNYLLYQIMKEAGMQRALSMFYPWSIPLESLSQMSPVLISPVYIIPAFTILRALCTQIGTNTDIYKNFPRIVGESGGKNFHLIHDPCKDDVERLASEAVCSAYKQTGQSTALLTLELVPKTIWEQGDPKRLSCEKRLR